MGRETNEYDEKMGGRVRFMIGIKRNETVFYFRNTCRAVGIESEMGVFN